MKNNNIMIRYSRFRFHWILACILIGNIACEKTDPLTPYDPGSPPIRLGTYHVTDQNEAGSQMTYEMGVHWIKSQTPDQIEFCNFGDLRINIIGYVNEDLQISIPAQQFSTDFRKLQIFQGMGFLTNEGFKLTYWAGNEKENYKSEIEAFKN